MPSPGHILNALQGHAHWLLRLAFGSVFLFHSIGKLSTLKTFAMMMMIPLWVAALVAMAELLGGLFVIAGGLATRTHPRLAHCLTRIGGAAVTPVLIGAIAMFHWGQWNFVPTESHPMGGMEFQLVLLALALYFLICGNRS